ncbi:hypothetical protein ACOMHN_042555 [Nucella lapillus]
MIMATVEVKREEREERGGEEGVRARSRQCLRRAILGRRQTAGLSDILVDLQQTAGKYERFSTLMTVNQVKEQEVNQLRAQLAHLTRIVGDHNRSGQCHLLPLSPNTENLSHVTSASPATTSWEESPPPPGDATDDVLIHQPEAEWELERYLQDLGPILPDSTFTDLDSFVKLDHADNILTPCLLPSSIPPPPEAEEPCHQHQYPPQAPTSPAIDIVQSQKGIRHSDLHARHFNQSLFCPTVSPATNQNRLSASSTASDRYSISEQWKGFCAMSGDLGTAPQSFGVVPDYKVDEDDGENGDDDVFLLSVY